MDAQELKELALEMTDCRSQSEQSIQTLVDTLKGNPLCVICGARNSGKTAVLATTVKLLDGDLYFLDEGGDSPNAADPAERMNRILAMRDTARARGKTAITCFSFPLNVRPDDNFLTDFVLYHVPPDRFFYADAVVYVNRTSWRIVKNRLGEASQQGNFDLGELLADRTTYDSVLYYSHSRRCDTDRVTLKEKWLLLQTALAQQPVRHGFRLWGVDTGRVSTTVMNILEIPRRPADHAGLQPADRTGLLRMATA